MKHPLSVGTASAAPGTRVLGHIPVATLANGEALTLPLQVINGAADGPRLWINGALHGNELNGVVAVLQLAQEIDPARLSGAVIVTPISNPPAFYAHSRLSPLDGGNLGESYPGSADGSITRQIAFHHFNAVKDNADFLIDLHASGVTNASKSYSVLKFAGHPETEQRALALLLACGIHLNCTVDTLGKNDEPVPLTGSLDLECMARGIPSFMLELGHAGRVEEEVVRHAKAGLHNALRHLGMVEGVATAHPGSVVTSQRFIVRCRTSGLAVQTCQPHDHVRKGELICRILDHHGRVLEAVRAEQDMHIISLREDCVVSAGDRVAFAAA